MIAGAPSWSANCRGFLSDSCAPAREQVAAALGDRERLELERLDQLAAGHDRERGGAAGELRVEREPELVYEAGREQVAS